MKITCNIVDSNRIELRSISCHPNFSVPGHGVLQEGGVLGAQAQQVEEREGAAVDEDLEARRPPGPVQRAGAEVRARRVGLMRHIIIGY